LRNADEESDISLYPLIEKPFSSRKKSPPAHPDISVIRLPGASFPPAKNLLLIPLRFSKTRNNLSAFFPAETNILENPGRFLISDPVPDCVSRALARRLSEVLPANSPEAIVTNKVSF